MNKLKVLVFGAFAFAGLASADIIPNFTPTITNVAGGFNFAYTVNLTMTEQLNVAATNSATACNNGTSPCVPPGTFFTIYDVPGLISANANGATTPASWTVLTQLMGLTPSGVVPVPGESSGVLNVTFMYNSPTIVSGPTSLGTFNIVSSFGSTQVGQYSTQATNSGSLLADQNRGNVLVPASSVPEPASMLLIGGGLVGLALLRRKLVR